MEVMILDPTDDAEMLRPLWAEWEAAHNGADFGYPIDINIGLDTMRRLIKQSDGDVLVLADGHSVKGFLGLLYGLNHVGPGKIANECCFFVSSAARGGGVRLIHAAEKLASAKGCNFLRLNASSIAGNADRSGKLFEHCGYPKFQSSYLKAL